MSKNDSMNYRQYELKNRTNIVMFSEQIRIREGIITFAFSHSFSRFIFISLFHFPPHSSLLLSSHAVVSPLRPSPAPSSLRFSWFYRPYVFWTLRDHYWWYLVPLGVKGVLWHHKPKQCSVWDVAWLLQFSFQHSCRGAVAHSLLITAKASTVPKWPSKNR